MKKVLRMAVKVTIIILAIIAVKVAVVDLWDCYLAVDIVEAAKKVI